MQTETTTTYLYIPVGTAKTKTMLILHFDKNLEDLEALHTPVGVKQRHRCGDSTAVFQRGERTPPT